MADPTITGPQIEAIAEILRTLGHETRLRLVDTLLAMGERSVGEIETITGIGQPGLSQQLAVLRKSGLVRTRRESKQVHYSLSREAIAAAAAYLGALAGRPADAEPRGSEPNTAQPARGSAAVFARIL